ncbi:hypothetical protein O181_061712 [Austropuccinia psidii MF-1]|uniref:Uncharacterized protein n=1 Tax=Austropuccinia psidii MF-1 TaxID=1389203 RepID=A0A9Q3HZN1_9BASI|nr:hypothetical protein [Austropuccinia psidii MF-1]
MDVKTSCAQFKDVTPRNVTARLKNKTKIVFFQQSEGPVFKPLLGHVFHFVYSRLDSEEFVDTLVKITSSVMRAAQNLGAFNLLFLHQGPA